MNNSPSIKYLFEPNSVAIIGASQKPGKIGYKIVENIIVGGYKGKIYPVNPSGGEMLGYKVHTSLEEISSDIDFVTITVPVAHVFEAVKSCAKKKVKFISIITSGFAEAGRASEEKEIVEFANTHGMRILGPNIFGIFVAKSSLIASFAPTDIKHGGVALVSQSGALGTAIIGESKVENIGLSAIISLGNKSDVDESDIIEYLVEDESTKVIFIYTEGVKNGSRLIDVLKKATKIKPIVVIKSGRSQRGAMAAQSHTGSLAGADEVFDAIMKECGVHRAESIPEAFNWAKFLSTSAKPKGENTVIITNGGGAGVLATDAAEKFGISLYDNQEVLKSIFGDYVPDFGSTKNPIDITGQVGIEGYETCVERAMNHPEIHSIVCIGCEHALFNEKAMKETIEKIHEKYGKVKPISYTFYGGQGTKNAITYLKSKNVPVFYDVYEAISSLGEVYKDYRRTLKKQSPLELPHFDVEKIKNIIQTAKKEKRNFLLASECQEMMTLAGIPSPKSKVASTAQEAQKIAEEISYPVVMKVVSRDILHKSDAGGVILNIKNKDEAKSAFETIMKNAKAYNSKAVITGVEVAEMLSSGLETIIGARRDSSFGPVVMFGQGGIYVEVLKDVTFRAFPTSKENLTEMIHSLKFSPLLNGVRGQKPKDKEGIFGALVHIGQFLLSSEEMTDIELNPLFVYEGKVRAVDSRILIK